jgi:GAF domain-containing protein
MAEDLNIFTGSKEEQYQSLLPQIKALIEGETDLIANLANITAALKAQFSWLWVGFYLVKNEELVLGPFQGPVACTRIKMGRGVCGTAWQQKETLIVADVTKFSGHIACSSLSKSEIVIPLIKDGEVFGVLDVDSIHLSDFDEVDKVNLKEILFMINYPTRLE